MRRFRGKLNIYFKKSWLTVRPWYKNFVLTSVKYNEYCCTCLFMDYFTKFVTAWTIRIVVMPWDILHFRWNDRETDCFGVVAATYNPCSFGAVASPCSDVRCWRVESIYNVWWMAWANTQSGKPILGLSRQEIIRVLGEPTWTYIVSTTRWHLGVR